MRHINRLKERYPKLLSQYLSGRDIEVGAGWIPVVEDALAQLDTLDVHVAHVKEKFGGLRINLSRYPIPVDAAAIIDAAEQQASLTCECCGSHIGVTTGGENWITTQCEACRAAGKRVFDA